MRLVTSACLIGAVGALLGNGAWAQSVISAHSGLVHYVEGRVLLGDKEIDPKFGEFPEIKNNQVLRTEEGRAEVLLSPGVFLRVAENSAVRMVSNRLADTQLEVQSGKALVECADVLKENAVTMQVGGDSVRLVKNGLYEFTATPANVRVYQGEAVVESGNGTVTVKKGREATIAAVVEEHKFDTALTDDLYNWSSRRSGYIAAANISSAKQISSGSGYGASGYGGYGYGGYGYGFGRYPYGFGSPFAYGGMGMNSGWAWNPLFGMFTYVPYDGIYMNPFGYAFWSPYTVGYVLPAYYGGVGRVYSGGGRLAGNTGATRGGFGGIRGTRGATSASAPYSTAAASAASHRAATAARSDVGGFARGGGWSGGQGAGRMSTSGAVRSTSAPASMPASSGGSFGGARGGSSGGRGH